MDFKYNYTRDQERFRRQVEAWLDANIPEDLNPAACREPSAEDWHALKRLRRLLGERGWLAAQEPREHGDLGASQGEEVVLAEELDKRGLGWLQDRHAASLWRALEDWATPAQIQEFMGPLTRGETVIWHSPLEPEAEVDVSGIEILATENGDDYVLNGRGQFVGIGPKPDLLWTLVRLCPESGSSDPDVDPTFSCLVPGALDGIDYPTSRQLTAEGHRSVAFYRVRVPRYYLLGRPGEGALLMQIAISHAGGSPAPHCIDTEASGLHQYLQDATTAGDDLDRQEILQQLVMESCINNRVARLFRMRDAWMLDNGGHITYQSAQTRLWEGRAAMRLAEIVREVVGPYCLLDLQDPRAPAEGRLELQQRGSLDQNSANGHWLTGRKTIARHLGLASSGKT